MRSRVVPWLVCAVVITAVPASADPGPQTDRQCRRAWSDLTSLHAEDDNPGGPVPQLTQRWDAYYATSAQYAETATVADCGAVIASFAATWGDLETLQYDLYPYDPLGRLAIAEGDRRHALHFHHVRHLSAALERDFRVARRQAPRALADLAPSLAPAADVDPDDPVAVHGVLRELAVAARGSHHQQRLNQVLRQIADAELDEE